MSSELTAENVQRVLSGGAKLPDHMVFRSFVAETVILNLQTGRYHGTNSVGGEMLEAMNDAPTVGDAARNLSEKFGEPLDRVERDIVEFCVDLEQRGLILLEHGIPS